MTPSGFIALVLGWWVAEVGRQPCTTAVRTADAVSPDITSGSVFASLTTYIAISDSRRGI